MGVPGTPEEELLSWNEKFNTPALLGRVHGAAYLRIFAEPNTQAKTMGRIDAGDVIPILGYASTMEYDARTASKVWFQTDGGWVHSAYVVPCHEHFNEPVAEDVALDKYFWGEITVPVCYQHGLPTLNLRPFDFHYYIGYWQQVYKIIGKEADDAGNIWYRIFDDQEERRSAWMMARNIRKISDDEFHPISKDVTDKKVVISLGPQILTCYEEGTPVFQTRIASGTTIIGDDGVSHDFSTPYGEYRIPRKRPARRMRGGQGPTEYDVNAVPWITYFTDTGAAIHGAYWHNNFGRPRSHGCINVTPDAAKWIYRWTQPYVDHLDDYYWTTKTEQATTVIITK